MRHLALIISLIVFLSHLGLADAQKKSPTDSRRASLLTLNIKITDSHNAKVLNAIIAAKSQLSGEVFQAFGSKDGSYQLQLPSGIYEIKIYGCDFEGKTLADYKIALDNAKLDVEVCSQCIVDGCGFGEEIKPIDSEKPKISTQIIYRPITEKFINICKIRKVKRNNK